MKNAVLVIVSMVLAPSLALAQNGVVQINQASVAATGANRATGGFPYQITQPGSYQLTSNLVVPAGADGIDILSNNVTLDLNGFTISGPVTCTGSGATLACSVELQSGIVSNSSTNVTIRNGSVVGFYDGVFLNGQGNLVEDVHVSGNYNNGIFILNGVARRNTANLNGSNGIVANGSTVTENVVNFNRGYGLFADTGGLYGSNTFQGNGFTSAFNDGSFSQGNNSCNGAGC